MKNGKSHISNLGKPRRHILLTVILIVSALMILLASAVFLNLPKPKQVSNDSFQLDQLKDGIYQGQCDNGLVYARVEVEIRNQQITDIKLLEHRNGMGQAAEEIVNTVTARQSVEVDAVSGATFSSQTILKAVENALSANGGN